ncbi:MAG: hypothetical protein IJD93_06080 [Ruminococcus sp.]|nr:hypothetical protein [Ruminococcus sp.]
MKRSTFRKSSLISSVALLLVAIVALSGATFAWFSTSNTATASGVDVTSAAGGGLQISEDTATWGSTVQYKNGGNTGRTATLNPASCAFADSDLAAPSFFTGQATDTDKYDVNTDGFSSATTGFYNKYDLYAKSKDAGTISVSHTPEASCGYARIAIVDVTDSTAEKLVYYWRPTDTDDKAPVKAAGTTNVLDDTFEARFGSADGGTNVIVENESTKKDIAVISANTPAHFVIYVWYEGQDVDCTSVLSAKAFTTAFNFELTPTQAAG